MLDDNNIIKRFIFRLVKKHISGSTLSSALDTIRELNGKGLRATVTFLNENVDEPSKARYNTNTYVQFIKQTIRLHLNSDISVRMSQLGYKLNNGIMDNCLDDIFAAADGKGAKVWIEHEPGIKLDEHLKLYRAQRKRYKKLGIEIPIREPIEGATIRKYLRAKDNVRLTSYLPDLKEKEKGPHKNIFENYISTIGRLLQAGVSTTVLDESEKTIIRIANFSKEYKKSLIFELPLGCSNRRLSKLQKMKLNLSIYTPYGKDWAPYVINKLTSGHMRDIAAKVLAANKGTLNE